MPQPSTILLVYLFWVSIDQIRSFIQQISSLSSDNLEDHSFESRAGYSYTQNCFQNNADCHDDRRVYHLGDLRPAGLSYPRTPRGTGPPGPRGFPPSQAASGCRGTRESPCLGRGLDRQRAGQYRPLCPGTKTFDKSRQAHNRRKIAIESGLSRAIQAGFFQTHLWRSR